MSPPGILRKGLVWCTGLAAFLIGLWVWKYRLELFFIPAAFREVLREQALIEARESEPEGSRSGREGLDRAVSRLVALKRPGFPGARGSRMEKLRTRENGTAYFICSYDERPIDPGAGAEYVEYVHLLLDHRGRLISSDPAVFEKHKGNLYHGVKAGAADGFDVVLSGSSGCVIHEGDYNGALSVDAHGWVPQGGVDMDLLVSFSQSIHEPVPPDRGKIVRLLSSPRLGDLFRALHLMERSSPLALDLAVPLLSRADPWLRARAAAVIGTDPARKPALAGLLDDPDPRVRASAAHAVEGGRGWERLVLPLTDDADPRVAREAHALLLRGRDRRQARASYLHLLLRRDAAVTRLNPREFTPRKDLSSPQAAEALLAWLEDELDPGWKEGDGESLVDDQLHILRGEDILPLAPRLIAFYRRMERAQGPRGDIAAALAGLTDARAEGLIAGVLSIPGGDGWGPRAVREPGSGSRARGDSSRTLRGLRGRPGSQGLPDPGPLRSARRHGAPPREAEGPPEPVDRGLRLGRPHPGWPAQAPESAQRGMAGKGGGDRGIEASRPGSRRGGPASRRGAGQGKRPMTSLGTEGRLDATPPPPSRSGSGGASRRGSPTPGRRLAPSRAGRWWCRSRARATSGRRCPGRRAGP